MFPCRILIEDLQAQIEAQVESRTVTPRSHSYTKYNSWDKVRASLVMHLGQGEGLLSYAFVFCAIFYPL